MIARRQLQVVAAALAVAALANAPARAAFFEDEDARKRIEATNQKLNQIQRQLEDRIGAIEDLLKSQGLVEIFNQIELLKADTARLRGQFEVLAHEQEEAQKRQRDLYIDLDTRLRRLETAAAAQAAPAVPGAAGPVVPGAAGPGVAPGASPGAPPGANAAAAGVAGVPPATSAGTPPPTGPAGAGPGRPPVSATPPVAVASAAPANDPAAEQRAYDAALDLFRAGKYGAAIGGFAAFTKSYPKSPLAPSAQYWIGNAYFAQRDFRSAIATQRQLIATYPDSVKVPDALLNIATAQFESGDAGAARRTLNDLIAKYPQTDAATKARARLSQR